MPRKASKPAPRAPVQVYLTVEEKAAFVAAAADMLRSESDLGRVVFLRFLKRRAAKQAQRLNPAAA